MKWLSRRDKKSLCHLRDKALVHFYDKATDFEYDRIVTDEGREYYLLPCKCCKKYGLISVYTILNPAHQKGYLCKDCRRELETYIIKE